MNTVDTNMSKIPGVKVVSLTVNKDQRGLTVELWRGDQEIKFNPSMAYFSTTKPGQVRGPHEHTHQTDYFCFTGPGVFRLELWDNRKYSDPENKGKQKHESFLIGENSPCIAIIPPGVVHGYKNISSYQGLIINLPDKLYKGIGKSESIDETRWEDDKDSPYRIY